MDSGEGEAGGSKGEDRFRSNPVLRHTRDSVFLKGGQGREVDEGKGKKGKGGGMERVYGKHSKMGR